MNVKHLSIIAVVSLSSISAAYGFGSPEVPNEARLITESDFPMPTGSSGWRQIAITAPVGAEMLAAEVEIIAVDRYGYPSTIIDRATVEPGGTYIATIGVAEDDDVALLHLSASTPVSVQSTTGSDEEPSDDAVDDPTLYDSLFAGNRTVFGSRSPQAAAWCWCTRYVANRFGLSGYPDATRWDNGYLTGKGWKRSSDPSGGYIMVIEGYSFGTPSQGHVGVIDKRESLDSKRWKITLRGANQPGSTSTEYNCTNVTKWVLTIPKGDSKVSYWKR